MKNSILSIISLINISINSISLSTLLISYRVRAIVFNAIFNNISALLVEETKVPGKYH
jgi:hypothetical protein